MIPLHDDNPCDTLPLISISIIVLCSLTFLWQLSFGTQQPHLIVAFGAIPAVILGSSQLPPELHWIPAPLTLVSSMFLHGGWLHLIGNMLYLWIFGDNVEHAMGRVRFVLFYLLCGVIAAMAHILGNPSSTIPMVGASGAIAGVLGAYVLLYPHARILVLVPIFIYITTVRLSAILVLGFWFAWQILSSLLSDPDSAGVAWSAHIAGFVAGLVLIPLFKYRRVRLLAPAKPKR